MTFPPPPQPHTSHRNFTTQPHSQRAAPKHTARPLARRVRATGASHGASNVTQPVSDSQPLHFKPRNCPHPKGAGHDLELSGPTKSVARAAARVLREPHLKDKSTGSFLPPLLPPFFPSCIPQLLRHQGLRPWMPKRSTTKRRLERRQTCQDDSKMVFRVLGVLDGILDRVKPPPESLSAGQAKLLETSLASWPWRFQPEYVDFLWTFYELSIPLPLLPRVKQEICLSDKLRVAWRMAHDPTVRTRLSRQGADLSGMRGPSRDSQRLKR